MTGFDIKTDVYEGPFELLFHLIRKNEMDIYNVKIAELTDQYMEYISALDYGGMDGLSQFLLMAATLLEIKSAMLLPIEQSDAELNGDPRDALTQMLVEYEMFKSLAADLKEKEERARLYITRQRDDRLINSLIPVRKTDINELLGNITIEALGSIFADIIRRRELSLDTVRHGFGTVNMDKFTINDKIGELRHALYTKERLSFMGLLRIVSCALEAVTLFCAMLEMIKAKEITVIQDENFSDIIITKTALAEV